MISGNARASAGIIIADERLNPKCVVIRVCSADTTRPRKHLKNLRLPDPKSRAPICQNHR